MVEGAYFVFRYYMFEAIDYRDYKHAPRVEQAAFVVAHILDHMKAGGSYRHLIYSRLGFGPEAYGVLQMAGALDISNLCPVKEPEERSYISSLTTGHIIQTIEDKGQWGIYVGSSRQTPYNMPYRGKWMGKNPPLIGQTCVMAYIVKPGSGTPVAYPVDEFLEFDAFNDTKTVQ